MVAPAAQLTLGIALAEAADRPATWPGLGRRSPGPLRLIMVADRAGFGRISRGRVPDWGVGMALPGARAIVVRADAADARSALRHELAHLALHEAVRTRLPLWFDEGYAVVAAGEWNRFDALQLNLAVVRGAVADLRSLDAALRQGPSEAETAYALAGSAVLHLARLNPDRTLDALLRHLQGGDGFDAAVVATTGRTLDGFEEVWRRDVRRRYSLLVWLAAGGGWSLVGVLVIAAVAIRRRRDQPRREALNIGWELPPEAAADDPGELDQDRPGD